MKAATQEMPSETICQRSWSSTSATATLNLLCSRAMSDLTTCRLSLSEWFWGRRSQTRQRPTVTSSPLRCPAGKREGGRRKESSQSSFLFLLPASSFLQRRQVLRLLQAEVLQEAEGSAEQVGPACRAGASDLRDQTAGPQRRQGAVAICAADSVLWRRTPRLRQSAARASIAACTSSSGASAMRARAPASTGSSATNRTLSTMSLSLSRASVFIAGGAYGCGVSSSL